MKSVYLSLNHSFPNSVSPGPHYARQFWPTDYTTPSRKREFFENSPKTTGILKRRPLLQNEVIALGQLICSLVCAFHYPNSRFSGRIGGRQQLKTRKKGLVPPSQYLLNQIMNLLRWITHKMVILILFVMFCALITSSYDFTHDVLCTHRIVV